MKKLDLKKILYGGLAVSLAVGIGWGVSTRLNPNSPGNLIDKEIETASITRRLKPVPAKEVSLSVSGENLPQGVSISAIDMNYEFINISSSGDKNQVASSNSFEEAKASVLKEKDIAFAYDIDLGHELKDGESVEVTIDNLKINNPSTFMILHIKDNGEREYIEPLYVDNTKVTFKTTSFSFYAGYDTTPMKLSVTVTENTVLRLPLAGTLNVAIDWGDGTIEGGITEEKPEHTYTSAGTYTIQIAGSSQYFGTQGENNDGTNLKTYLTKVLALGDLSCSRYGFYNYTNLTSVVAGSGVDISNATNLTSMFDGCTSLKTIDLRGMNTSAVKNMTNMFKNCIALEKIFVDTAWSTSAVTTSTNMFQNAVEITGGNGTTFNASYIDKTYARIDTAGTLGYLSNGRAYKVDAGSTNVGYYPSLQEATDAISSNSNTTFTITLQTSTFDTSKATIPSGKTVTLNFGSNTLTSNVADFITVNGNLTINTTTSKKLTLQTKNAIKVASGGKLTLTNSVIESTDVAIYSYGEVTSTGTTITSTNGSAIDLYSTSKLTVNSGTIKGKTSAIITASAWSGSATIKAGTIESTGLNTAADFKGTGTVTLGDNSTGVSSTAPVFKGGTGLKVSGTLNMYDGIVKGTTTAISGTVSGKPSGYGIVKGTSTESGVLYNVNYVGAGNYSDGTNLYDTLNDAVTMASSGKTITVNATVSDSSTVEIPSGKTLTLKLNSKTVTMSNTIDVRGTLTITGAGTLITYASAPLIENNGTLTINGGAVISGGTYGILANKSFTFSAGTIKGTTAAYKLEGIAQPIIPSGYGIATSTDSNYKVATVSPASYEYNGNKYATLKDAYEAAVNAGASSITIKAVAETIVDESTVTIASGKTVTLDTERSTITFKNAIAVNGTLILSGGGIIKGDTYGVNKTGTGTIRVQGVEIIGERYGLQSTTSIYFDAGVIRGCTSATNLTNSAASLVIPSGVSKNEYYTTQGTVYHTIEAKAGNYMIGTNSYSTLANAVSAAADGDTIRLVNACQDTSGATIPSNKKLKLDINGKALRIDSSTVTINGRLDVYGQGIISTTTLSYMFTNNGVFTINVNQLTNNFGGIIKNNSNSARAEVLGGYIRCEDSVVYNIGTGEVIIGSIEGRLADKERPMVLSQTYAVNSASGFKFYDGSLKGISAAYTGRVIEYAPYHQEYNYTDSSGYKVAELEKLIDGVVIDVPDQVYTGKSIDPGIVVYDATTLEPLEKGFEYSYTLSNNLHAGVATVTITGITNYKGTTTRHFNILPVEVDFEWVGPYEFEYDGNRHAPQFTHGEGVNNETLVFSVEEKTDVGVYTATPILSGVNGGNGNTSNYTFKADSKEFEIYQAESGIAFETNVITIYAGNTANVKYTIKNDTNLSYTVENSEVAVVKSLDTQNAILKVEGKGAGVTTIKLKAQGNENIKSSETTLVVIVLTSAYTDGSAFYTSLLDAITNAGSGKKLTLLEDVEETDSVTIPSGKVFTLNLNENNISLSGITTYITNNGTFILTNELPKAGDIPNHTVETGRTPNEASILGESISSILKNTGTMTIKDDMLIKAKNNTIVNSGTLTINGSKISNVSGTHSVIKNSSTGSVNVTVATIEAQQLGFENAGMLLLNGGGNTIDINANVAVKNTGTGIATVKSSTLNGNFENTSTANSTFTSSIINAMTGIESSAGTITVSSSSKIDASIGIKTTADAAKVVVNGSTIISTSTAAKAEKGTIQIGNLSATTITSSANGLDNSGGTIILQGNSSVTATKTALKATGGTTTISNATLESTGTEVGIDIDAGTVAISNATLKSANATLLNNATTLEITSSTIDAGGTSTVNAIENSGTLTLKDVTMTADGAAIKNDGTLNLKDSTNITALIGITNNSTTNMGTEDNTINSNPKVTATNTAFNNTGTFNWYDGELKGKAENVYVGTDPTLQDKVAIASEISGQTKRMYLTRDTSLPVITQLITQTDWTPGNATIQVIATDNTGIAYYGINTVEEEPTEWQETNVFSVTENGTYYIFIKDTANNVVSKYINITKVCKNIWNTTGTTGSATRAILKLDGTLFFEVTARGQGTNANATGYVKNYTADGGPWANNSEVLAIEVDNGILGLGVYALAYLPTADSIKISGTVALVDITTFVKTNNYSTVYVDGSSTALLGVSGIIMNKNRTLLYAYSNKLADTEYNLEYSVTTLAPYAFYNNKTLTKLTISNKITSLGEKVFEGVTGDVYYYTSSAAMRAYVKANKDEANFIPIDDYAPVIEIFTLNNGEGTCTQREVMYALIATDDMTVEKMFITEEFYDNTTILLADENKWVPYITSGKFTISEQNQTTKTVYAWVKDSSGNISLSASATVYYHQSQLVLKGQETTVQYVDTTGQNYYRYDEDVQGGYIVSDELRVEITGVVDHTTIRTYQLIYAAYAGVNTTPYETKTRTVDVIANNWNTTVYTENGYQYMLHANGKYAKIVGFTGTKSSIMSIPMGVLVDGIQIPVIDIGANIFGTVAAPDNTVTSVVLPETIINISSNAFEGCNELSNINIPNSVMRIEQNALAGVGGSSGINLVLSDNVRVIENNAFINANIKSLTLGKLLKQIGEEAFANNSYTGNINLTIPVDVKSIGNKAFYRMKIGTLNVASGNTDYKMAADGLAVITADNKKLVLYKNSAIDSGYTLPNQVVEIVGGAFSAATNLKSVILNNTQVIGEGAFAYSSLAGVRLSENVTSVATEAFANIATLKVAVLQGTTTIATDTFKNDAALAGVIFTNKEGVVDLESANSIPTTTKIFVSKDMLNTYKSNSDYSGMTSRLDNIITLEGLSYTDWPMSTPFIESGAWVIGELLKVSGPTASIPLVSLEIDGVVDANTTARYRIKYNVVFEGIVLDTIERIVDIADFEKPVITAVVTNPTWTLNEQTFEVIAEDNLAVSEYIIKDTATKPTATDSSWQKSNTFTVTTVKTWYIYARDDHGNISDAYVIDSDLICTAKWDISENEDESLLAVIPLSDTTKFVVSGTGSSKDYEETEVPWYGNEKVNGISKIVVEEGVVEIGKNVLSNFDDCGNITLPSTLTNLNTSAFINTNNYSEMVISGNANFYTDGYTLYSADKKILYVHSNEYTSTYSLPTTVEEIGGGAFMNNGAISILDLSNVKIINDKAFNGAIHITNLYVPKTLESIGKNVFAGITTGPIYYYSSCGAMMNYVKDYGTEANFVLIDDVAPVITSVKINDGETSSTSTTVTVSIEAYDDVGITHIIVTETEYSSIAANNPLWEEYDNSGTYSYTFNRNGNKTLYVWLKDAAGNVSEVPGEDSITIGSYDFNMLGQENIVMYQDTTSEGYYEYDEDVQGGYEFNSWGMTVQVSGTVNTRVIRTYEIQYRVRSNFGGFGGNGNTTYTRTVDVIANSWGNTVYTSGQFEFVKHASKNYAKIVGYTGTASTVSIPSSVSDGSTTYTVIDIGTLDSSILSYNTVSRIILPETIINIGANAFKGMDALMMINIPESVLRIEESAFEGTSLTDIVFSDNLRVVEAKAFADAGITDLKTGTLLRKIEAHAFKNASWIEELAITENIDVIEETAFSGANIIKISGSTSDNKYYAVDDKYLIQTVNGENTIIASAIGSLATEETVSLENIYRIGAESFAKAKSSKINVTTAEEIGENAFKGSSLVEFTVPSDTVLIEDGAFDSCSKLTTVIIDGAPEISANVFSNDNALVRLVLLKQNDLVTLRDDNVLAEQINIYAFEYEDYKADTYWRQYEDRIYPIMYLNGEAEITMEAGTIYVEEGAYIIGELFTEDGTSTIITSLGITINNPLDTSNIGRYEIIYTLTSRGTEVARITRVVKIIDTVPPIITKITTEDVPQPLQEKFTVYATDNVAVDRYAITQSNEAPALDSSVWTTSNMVYATSNGTWFVWVRDTSGNMAMQEVEATNVCTAVWDIGVVENTVFAVLNQDGTMVIRGTGATKDYTSETLPWKDSLDEITAIDVWEGITNIGEYVLSGATNATSIALPKSLKTIRYTTFAKTNNFDTVTIADGNTALIYDDYCLYSKDESILYVHTNKDLRTEITIKSNTKAIADYAFANNETLITVNAHDEIEINDGAFYNNKNLTTINGAVGREKIGKYAFAKCSKLSSIDIFDEVEVIGSYAFSECNALTEINLEAVTSLSTLEHHAFANLYNIFEMTVPITVTEITEDENGIKNVFENLGQNYGVNAVVYYYDSCEIMGTYARETPDLYVDFIEKDTTGPILIKLEVSNLETGDYAAGTEIKFQATFSEECNFNKGVLPVLKIQIGDGAVRTLQGVPNKKTIIYTYVVQLEDYGEIDVVSFEGTVYDLLDKFSVLENANLTGPKIFIKTVVRVVDPANGIRYFAGLKQALAGTSGIAEFTMLMDDVITSTMAIKATDEYIINMNNKTVSFTPTEANVLITNKGVLKINDTGKLIISGPAQMYGIMNEGEITFKDVDIEVTNSGNGSTYGIHNFANGLVYMKSGSITTKATKEGSNAYGIYNEGAVYMESGDITVTTVNSRTYGVHNKGILDIATGNISARLIDETAITTVQGIYNAGGKTTLGRNDDTMTTASPYIYGVVEGVRNASGTLEFYDGTIEGSAYNSIISDDVKTVAGYAIVKQLVDNREFATLGMDTEGPLITVQKDPDTRWTNEYVMLTIEVFDEKSGVQKADLDGQSITLVNGKGTIKVTQNGTYTVAAYDNANNISTKSIEIKNIDTVGPTIHSVEQMADVDVGEVKLQIVAEDAESGIYAYAVNKRNIEPSSWRTRESTTEQVTLEISISSNGEYYVFVKDSAGNVTKYPKAIKIAAVDTSAPEITAVSVDESNGYVNSSMILLNVEAEDDVEVTHLLLSNELLTINELEAATDWVPYTEEVLWKIPDIDGTHTVYVWAKDSVDRKSSYGAVTTKLLSQYIGGNGTNQTSFRILYYDNNYDYENTLTANDMRIIVKDTAGNVTFEGAYGTNIRIEGEPTLYGPIMQGTEVLNGRYYKVIAENTLGSGTLYLALKNSTEQDKAGNSIGTGVEYELPTDVMIELSAPTIRVSDTQIIVSDTDGNGMGYIKVNGKTVRLSSGRITLTDLLNMYEIELVPGTVIEAADRCSNVTTYIVQ